MIAFSGEILLKKGAIHQTDKHSLPVCSDCCKSALLLAFSGGEPTSCLRDSGKGSSPDPRRENFLINLAWCGRVFQYKFIITLVVSNHKEVPLIALYLAEIKVLAASSEGQNCKGYRFPYGGLAYSKFSINSSRSAFSLVSSEAYAEANG